MRADSQFSPSLSYLPTVGLLSVLIIVELARGHHAQIVNYMYIIVHKISKQDYLSFFRLRNMTDSLLKESEALSIVTAKSRNIDYQSCIANKIPNTKATNVKGSQKYYEKLNNAIISVRK